MSIMQDFSELENMAYGSAVDDAVIYLRKARHAFADAKRTDVRSQSR